MCNITLGEMTPYTLLSFSSTSVQKEQEENVSRHATDKDTRTEMPDIIPPDVEQKTAWDNYLALKSLVMKIEVCIPMAGKEKKTEKTHELMGMIRECQKKIKNIDEEKLKRLIENRASFDFLYRHPDIIRQSVSEMRDAINTLTNTTNAINLSTEKGNNDARNGALKVIYIAAGIALSAIAIGLTAIMLPYIFPTVFITGTKAALLLDSSSRLLIWLFGAMSSGLALHHGVTSYHDESGKEAWRKISEKLSNVRDYFEEVRDMDIDVFIDGINHINHVASQISGQITESNQTNAQANARTNQEIIRTNQEIINLIQGVEQRLQQAIAALRVL